MPWWTKCKLIAERANAFCSERRADAGMSKQWSNWARSVTCYPAVFAEPDSVDAIRAVLKAARDAQQAVRVAGSGHSFTPLCATDGTLLSLRNYCGVTDVDIAKCRVRVRAGTSLRALGAALAEHGLAMENLGDIDVQGVAGALATGTHGTGVNFGSLATQITGLRLLLADGSELWCSRESELEAFHAARVHLGALGVVTEIELACVPAYRLEYRSSRASLSSVLENLDALQRENRNFECYWFPYTDSVQLKTMNATQAPVSGNQYWRRAVDLVVENGAFWALSAFTRAVPTAAPAICRLEGASVPSHHSVQASHAIYATRRLVKFVETEFSIPVEHLQAALIAIRDCIERECFAVNFPLEIRFVAADDIPLSPAYGRASAYIAAHMYKGMPHAAYFAALTEIFDHYGGRPHWGKIHHKTAADFAKLYPEWQVFQDARRRLDPQGLFLNAHLRQVFGV